MPRILSFLAAMCAALLGSAGEARSRDIRAYISIFQSGQVIVADAASGSVVHTLPVDDAAGIAVVMPNAADGRLYVVDGTDKSRLRVFHAGTLSLLATHPFDNRALSFSSDGRQAQLSRDGQWLFIHTYSYPDAAAGIRVFDIGRAAFVGSGVRDRACPKPLLVSTSSGSVFALCPEAFQDISPQPYIRGEFATRATVAVPQVDVSAAAATPDGHHLYAVGQPAPAGGWRLAHWDRRSGALDMRDLAAIVDMPAFTAIPGRQAWLGLSADARYLFIVKSSDLWLIDRESLKLASRINLPSPAIGVAIAPDGDSVLALHRTPQDGTLSLATIPFAGGRPHAVRLQTSIRLTGPTMLAAGSKD
jgi:hypothetical protein